MCNCKECQILMAWSAVQDNFVWLGSDLKKNEPEYYAEIVGRRAGLEFAYNLETNSKEYDETSHYYERY